MNAQPRPKVGVTERSVGTKLLIEAFSRSAALIPLDDAENLVRELERLETTGPLFDPTAWIDVQDTYPDHLRLARAFLTFRRELEAFKP